ncbi:MAG: hypothetical protein J5859_00140, partial [Clostridia bacterium]|nr:hypothetical protein [Clostridia bacterium]
MKNCDLFRNENEYPSFPAAQAVERLRQALRFRTVSYVDTSRICYDQFDALRAFLRESYPAVMEAGTYEEIGRSLLITIPGSDASLRPALFMAHQDVVPVVPGTQGDWLH